MSAAGREDKAEGERKHKPELCRIQGQKDRVRGKEALWQANVRKRCVCLEEKGALSYNLEAHSLAGGRIRAVSLGQELERPAVHGDILAWATKNKVRH